MKLSGPADTQIKQLVYIIPRKKYPFKIIGAKARVGKDIRYRYDVHKSAEGNGYVVTVENLKKTKGRYYDAIHLKTDSKISPNIVINVYGSITEDENTENKNTEKR